jgi:hypothetical protein
MTSECPQERRALRVPIRRAARLPVTASPVKQPWVTVSGNISVAVRSLEKIWKRRGIVPEALRDERVSTRTSTARPKRQREPSG